MIAGITLTLASCAEVQVGVELAKRANRALDTGPGKVEPLPQQAQQVQQAGVSPYLEPAPSIFEATGIAQWDGKRTLQGVWVAHPLATTARRVRVFNNENGLAVDGALFKRDAALGGASVLVSSEAAQRLGIEPGGSAELRIVAVTPVQTPQSEQPAAADTAAEGTAQPEEPTTSAVEAPVESGTSEDPVPSTTEATLAPAPAPAPTPAPVPAPAPQVAEETTAPSAPTTEPTDEPPAAEPEKATAERNEPSDTDGDFKWESATVTEPTARPVTRIETPSTPEPPEPPTDNDVQTASTTSTLKLPFVQAGIFGVAENAKRLIKRLNDKGIPAEGKAVTSGERTLTRVVAGPFETVSERDAAQAAIRKMGLPDATPVRR